MGEIPQGVAEAALDLHRYGGIVANPQILDFDPGFPHRQAFDNAVP